MRKIFFVFLLSVFGLAAQAGVHRCGTYNIRTCYGEADTGERAWDKRKQALVDVIRDSMQFDILGINEARDLSLAYLKQELGDVYSFYGDSKDLQNQVLYRTAKYTLLDKGLFYLSSDPSRRLVSWDDDGVHLTVWVKLQDKVSGEIIYFGSTHMSLSPIAIREGARINAEQMSKIAGDYACIVTGDMNSEPSEHDSHANFGTMMANARQITKTAPQGYYGTYIPGMNPNSMDAKLLDFLYVRNVEVESYMVYSKATQGRTLAPSDHQPVMCEVKVLSPYRDFVHSVKSVEELREVAGLIQPNDIILLKDGVYDLGDSSLYVANTCVIEGGKNTVLTGQTQLFSLPDYISLELKGLTIRDAQCSALVQGSLVHARGAYLKLRDCKIESCSTEGEGLIYVADCAATVENCVFRENASLNWNAGIQVVSSLGSDRYPLTMSGCLFDGNQSMYAPALYYNSEATAYLSGNSFVNNTAEEKGAVVFYAPNNGKDIRLVNNTFVNNRIDVEAGFLVEGIGGSAIWQEQSNGGSLTLMNNTIVGNYTACWEQEGVSSIDFAGGALCSYSGKLGLYNNIIAGNYGSKPNSGDITIADVRSLRKTMNNIYTCSSNLQLTPDRTDMVASDYVTAGVELKNLFGGFMDEQGVYHVSLHKIDGYHLPVLSPMVSTYASMNIAILDSDAMSAAMIGSDILNKGSNMGILAVDQLGFIRNYYSVPGAMEQGKYVPSGWQSVTRPSTLVKKVLKESRVVISDGKKLYEIY